MKNVTLEPGRHYDAVIVGGGQAGLSMSKHLAGAGVEHVVLERDEVAHEWRDGRWDNFTLVTPNWHCRLPGFAYVGPEPDGFMTRDEVFSWVRRFADSFDAPVAQHTSVQRVLVRPDGLFAVATSAGDITASAVTIATGGYHVPLVPAWATALPDTIIQIHSYDYRNPDALPPGEVLVVGTGQSGTQIAEDLHLAGRTVHLAVGRAPRVARFYRGKDCMTWLAEMGVYDIPIGQRGISKRESTNHYVTGRDGGRDIDLRLFATQGMQLYGKATGYDGTAITFEPTLAKDLDYADSVAESIKNDIDGYIAAAGIDAPTQARYVPVWRPETEPTALSADQISAIVWSIGFAADYSWLAADVLDPAGHPVHDRGITAVDGLSFVGLPWLNTWGSGRFLAIDEDTGYVARHIVDLLAARRAATPLAG